MLYLIFWTKHLQFVKNAFFLFTSKSYPPMTARSEENALLYIKKIQIFQNEVLRVVANAFWFMRNVHFAQRLPDSRNPRSHKICIHKYQRFAARLTRID